MAKRIVVDVTPLLYTQNGIGRVTRHLITAMLSAGSPHELAAFGRRLTGGKLRDLGLGCTSTHLRLPRASERVVQRLRLVDALCRGDLYHATDFYLPVAAVEKTIATIHDVIFLTQPEKMVDHDRLARWVPGFARRCRAIITVSECSKRDIVEQLEVPPGKVHVIHPGVDHALFAPPDAGFEARATAARLGILRPYYLAVSCSTGRKNTPALLEAYATLARHQPANDLVLVWSPPDEIRAAYARGKLGERIHFLPRQPDHALVDLYRGATALVFPSLYEGFGMPVLEALSCGTPVIAGSGSSLPEVGGTAAAYVDLTRPGALVAALEQHENDRAPRPSQRERCVAQASRFSWERCARETLALYDQCLAT